MKHALSTFSTSALRAAALITLVVSMSVGWLKAAVPAAGQSSMSYIYLPMIVDTVPTVSSLALIEKALQAGQINYATSLLYRAYAQFDDARLPTAYRGNLIEEDSSLFREYTDAAATLPAAIKAQLAPFMVRPDDPASAWSVYAAAHPASSGSTNDSPQASSGTQSFACIPNSNWAAVTSTAPGVKAKVWATCDGTYEANLLTILGFINDLWGPETAFMGQPVLDQGGPSGGGGPEIDIYLLNPLNKTPGGRMNFVSRGALGVTYSAPPFVNNASSAYILVPRDLVYKKDTKDTIAHEFFHVLQDAHNQEIEFENGMEWWFVEASANWAGAYFVPETSDTDHEFYSQNDTYDYQHSMLSLNAAGQPGTDEWMHPYMAYIWPYFIEQERGAKAIADIWKAMDWGLSTSPSFWTDADKLIDNVLPFKDNFYRFAVRNLNFDLEPGSPIYPRFVDQDPKFPDNVEPPMLNKGDEYLPATASSEKFSYNLPALLAVYYHFAVPNGVQQVEILPTNASSPIRLEALVKARGGAWSLQDLAGVTKVKLCNVEELYVVASNSDLVSEPIPGGNPRQVSFDIHASDLPCTCSEFANAPSVIGAVSFSYNHSVSNATDGYQLDEKGSTQFTLPQMSSGSGGVDFWGDVSGTGSIHNVYTDYTANPPAVYKTDGDGPAIKPDYLDTPMANLNINFLYCTYNFDMTIYLNMTVTDSYGATSSIQGKIGTVRSDDYPLIITTPATTLSGGLSFPAHSLMWGYMHPGNAYFPGMDGEGMFNLGAATDDNAGSASVAWSFTAQILPP